MPTTRRRPRRSASSWLTPRSRRVGANSTTSGSATNHPRPALELEPARAGRAPRQPLDKERSAGVKPSLERLLAELIEFGRSYDAARTDRRDRLCNLEPESAP